MERKSNVKETMMLRISLVCSLIILTVIVLFVLGKHKNPLNFAFWEFFADNIILSAYLVLANIAAFITFGIDKYKAVKGKYRIKIVTLIGLAFFGGSVGALLGMKVFRHKTKVNYFTIGVPLIIVTQMVLLFYIMNI